METGLFKNLILEQAVTEGLTNEGMGIVRKEGFVIFVKDSFPGEVNDIRIISVKKNYAEARIAQRHQISEIRTDPKCIHFGICGGCKWQHIEYPAQLALKQGFVKDAFERIARLTPDELPPVVPSPQVFAYRNKLEYTFSRKRWFTRREIDSGDELPGNGLGFHVPGHFDKVIHIEDCHLQPDISNRIRNLVYETASRLEIPFFDVKKKTGQLRNLMIRTNSRGEAMAVFHLWSEPGAQEESMFRLLTEQIPEMTSLCYVVNPTRSESYSHLPHNTFSGPGFLVENLDGLQFRIGPGSFFQVNPLQTVRLYQMAVDLAGKNTNGLLYDLYCGAGSISLFAAKRFKKVVGLESNASAVEDARQNAQLNGIENVHFHAGLVEKLLSEEFFETEGRPDVVITDPPRAGMHPNTVAQLLKVLPQRLVYISCNPVTQARDLQMLSEHYRLETLQPVDMFPHTLHVENIAALTRK